MGALSPPFAAVRRATKKKMDCTLVCTVSVLLGIMVLSHLSRDSEGEDSCNTALVSEWLHIKRLPIQDSVREML